MEAFIPVPFFVVSFILNLRAKNAKDLEKVRIFQPLTTIIVIAVAILSFLNPNGNMKLSVFIIIGLLFALGGDIVFIDRDDKKALTIGMMLFLSAITIYSFTLTAFTVFHQYDLIVSGILLVMCIIFIRHLYPGIKDTFFKIPVMVYCFMFFFLVSRAIACFFTPGFSVSSAVLLTLGAAIFLIGDFHLATYLFRGNNTLKSIIPVYYFIGQLMMALSLSFL